MFTRVGNLLSRPFPSIKTLRISWLPTTVSWFHTPVSTSWTSQTHYTPFSIPRVFTVSASCRISLPLFCYGLSMIRIHRFSKWGSIAEGIMWNRLLGPHITISMSVRDKMTRKLSFLLLTLIVLLQSGVMTYWASRKSLYHIDELYTFEYVQNINRHANHLVQPRVRTT